MHRGRAAYVGARRPTDMPPIAHQRRRVVRTSTTVYTLFAAIIRQDNVRHRFPDGIEPRRDTSPAVVTPSGDGVLEQRHDVLRARIERKLDACAHEDAHAAELGERPAGSVDRVQGQVPDVVGVEVHGHDAVRCSAVAAAEKRGDGVRAEVLRHVRGAQAAGVAEGGNGVADAAGRWGGAGGEEDAWQGLSVALRCAGCWLRNAI